MKMVKALGVCTFFFFIAVIVTFPTITHIASKITGPPGDNYQTLGFQFLAYDNLINGKSIFADTKTWRYPVGFEYARGFDGIFPTILSVVYAFISGGNSVFAYNMTMISALIINGLCSYLFFRYVTKSTVLGLIGGIAFGFSFYAIARASGHANMILIGGFPLTLYTGLRLQSHTTWKDFLAFFGSIFFLSLCSLQYFVMICIVLLILSILGFIVYPHKAHMYLTLIRDHSFKIGVLSGGFLLIFVATFLPYILAVLDGSFVHSQGAFYNPSLKDYIFPSRIFYVWYIFLSPNTQAHEAFEMGTVFIGFIELVFFLLFFFIPGIPKRLKLFVGLTVAVFFIFSLGTYSPDFQIPLIYSLLVDHLPFSAVAEAGRFVILVHLFIVIALVWVLKQVMSRNSRLLYGIGVGVLFLLALERVPVDYPLSDALDGEYARVVQRTETDAVLDIPLLEIQHSILPMHYEKKIVSGSMHWSADDDQSRAFIRDTSLERFICQGNTSTFYKPEERDYTFQETQYMLKKLRQEKINTIVIHKDTQLYQEGCFDVLTEYTRLFPRVHVVEGIQASYPIKSVWAQEKLNETLYFPNSGVVSVFSVVFTTDDPNQSALDVIFDGEPVDTSKWKKDMVCQENFCTVTYVPDDGVFQVRVSSGETLAFVSDRTVAQGYAEAWIGFDESRSRSSYQPLQAELIQIYEDEAKEVWRLQ